MIINTKLLNTKIMRLMKFNELEQHTLIYCEVFIVSVYIQW